jgi:hypothetical protein
MSINTLLEIWIICGIISAIWHVMDEWWQHKILEHGTGFTLLFNFFFAALALLLGPVSHFVKVWEKWCDPSNC